MKSINRYIKRWLVLGLALVLALGMVPAFAYEADEPAAGEGTTVYYFSDVPEDSYFFDAVYWALDRYVTNGTSEDTFSPELVCTRGQVMTFLWRAKGEPEPFSTENPFKDVPAGSYYERAVLWAVGTGITNGTSATTFSPDKVCNYAEILTFLWRFNGAPETTGHTHYTDGWPDSWYKDAISWAEEDELLEDAGDAVDPYQSCTRARTVTWLYRDAQVYVDSVEELMDAIGPGRDIHLAPGTYDLTSWINEKVGDSPDWDNPYVILEEVYDGYEAQIHDLRNTEFSSSTGDPKSVKIVVEPRYADVLSFYNCDNIMLRGLTLGHSPKKGSCAGSVVYMKDCGELWINDCDLYGCGTFGIEAEDSVGVYTADTVIRDCSEGLVQFNNVVMSHFFRCTLKNTEGGTLIFSNGTWTLFEECDFRNLSGNPVYVEEDGQVSFINCTMEKKMMQEIMNSPLYDENVFIRVE